MLPAYPYPYTAPAPIRRSAVVARGLGWGSVLGALVGGATGTLFWPIIGTVAGALIALPVGAVFGLVGGVVLALVDLDENDRTHAVITSGTAAAVSAALLTVMVHVYGLLGLLFVGVSTVLGAAIGPRVAFGPPAPGGGPVRRLTVPGRSIAGLLDWLGRGATAGFGTGAAVGAVLCALDGGPVATAMQSAVLGVPIGLVCGALVALGAGAVRLVG